ncbi:inositol monophosphatase [Patescibacteria group bacterium]|nr:inositol monophosphatase [Patescibacteria group bacterium]MBU2220780.1 inositol monophosphatase [Patescibacteria group bacterium]
MQDYLEVATKIAYEAGAIMKEVFAQGVAHTIKSDHSPVTDADKRINELVIQRIGQAYPTDSVLGEEGREMQESSHTWVCDPIDGTAAFMRGIPVSVFSLALVVDGEPQIGVVYDPHLDRLYTASKGGGAFMNGTPILTAENTELAHSYIETDGHSGFKNLSFFERALAADVRLLSFSSTIYAHMLVATGQIQGVVFPRTSPWDAASAKIIVEEAGGTTSDVHGKNQRYDRDISGLVSSCSEAFHKNLLALIAPSV